MSSLRDRLAAEYDSTPRNGHDRFVEPAGLEIPEGPLDMTVYGHDPATNEFTAAARGLGGIIEERQAHDSRAVSASSVVGYCGATGEVELKPESEFRIEFITSAELDTGDYTVDFLIEGVIPAREPGIIGAPVKGLKTTTAVDGYMSLSAGEDFLGKFSVPRVARCGMVSAESGFSALQRTGRAIAKSRGKRLGDYSNLLWSKQILDLGDARQLKGLRDWIDGEGLESVCLDPVYLMMSGLGDKASNIFDVGDYLIELTRIIAETGCGITLNHHFRKNIGELYQEPELEWLAYSGFANWVRWWWLLNRRSKYDPQNRGVHELWLHFGGSAGHSSAWAVDVDEGLQEGHGWTTDVRFASDAREERQQAQASGKSLKREMEGIAIQNANRAKVETALKTFPSGSTVSDIAAKAKVSNSIAKGVLLDLQERGVVKECEVRKANGQAYDGFIAVTAAEDAA